MNREPGQAPLSRARAYFKAIQYDNLAFLL